MIHSGGVIVTPVQFNPFEDVNKQLVDIEETDVKLEGKQLQCGVNVDKIISTLLAFRVQLTEHFNFRQSNSITIRIVLHAGTNYLSKSALLTVPADKELLKKQFLVVGIVGKACEWKVKTQNDGIAGESTFVERDPLREYYRSLKAVPHSAESYLCPSR